MEEQLAATAVEPKARKRRNRPNKTVKAIDSAAAQSDKAEKAKIELETELNSVKKTTIQKIRSVFYSVKSWFTGLFRK